MKRYFPMLLLVVLPVLAGCGSKPAENSTPAPEPVASTPAPAPAPAPDTTVLAKSLYDDGPRAGSQPVNAAKAALGDKLFNTKGCLTCHGWGKRLTGPDLKGVVMQRTALWMQNQILHPDVMTKTDPISHALFLEYKLQMLKLPLTADEATQIIEYLKQREKSGK